MYCEYPYNLSFLAKIFCYNILRTILELPYIFLLFSNKLIYRGFKEQILFYSSTAQEIYWRKDNTIQEQFLLGKGFIK